MAEAYSPNVLLMDENAVSAIHLCPYLFFLFCSVE
jgi:hypothetical protein